MLTALVAGGVNTLIATAHGGMLCGAVVAGAAGWVMAQYDHNYKRVQEQRATRGGR